MTHASPSSLLTFMSSVLLSGLAAAQALPAPYAWYRGEGNPLDSAAGAHHGQEVNGIGYAPGRTGQAFALDGVDDYVTLPLSALPPGPEFSVEAWFRMSSLFTAAGPCTGAGCDQAVFSNQGQVNGNGWRILKQANNQMWLLVNTSSAAVSTGGAVAANEWIHVVATFASWGQAGSTVALYVNGSFVGSAAAFGMHSEVRIGGDPSGNGVVNGLVDEVKIYASTLSAAQVTAAFAGNGSLPGTGPRDVELLDLDGDGDLDVATANEGSDNVSLRTNNGQGVLSTESIVDLTVVDTAPVALARCDADDDGARDDLAVVCETSHTLVLLINPSSASPTSTSLAVAGLRPSSIACGDLDSDPIDDIVVGRRGEPFAGGGGIALCRNGGATSSLTIPAPHSSQIVKVALGDLDGDGDLDLAALALGPVDELLLFAGDGAGAFTFVGALALATSGLALGACLSDLDGDGDNDLAVIQPQIFPPSQTLRIFRRTGTGALAPALFTAVSDIATTGTFGIDLASGDLEDDSIAGHLGRIDLAAANAGSGSVTIQHGFNGSAFVSNSSPTAGSNPVAVAIGDLDGDACDDVVVANQGSDDVTVILTAAPALAQPYGTGCGGPTIAAVGSPTLGNPAFGVRMSNARAIAPTLLMFATGPADVPLPPSICRLLLTSPISQLLLFSNGSGQATLTFGIPSGTFLLGTDVFFQGAVFRIPGGAFADVLDLSDALRVQVGS